MRAIFFSLRNAFRELSKSLYLKVSILLLLITAGSAILPGYALPCAITPSFALHEPLLIEHEIFRQGGVLLAYNQRGVIEHRQDVSTSPAIVDISCWNSGRYVLVFRSRNYDSIVASIEIPK